LTIKIHKKNTVIETLYLLHKALITSTIYKVVLANFIHFLSFFQPLLKPIVGKQSKL